MVTGFNHYWLILLNFQHRTITAENCWYALVFVDDILHTLEFRMSGNEMFELSCGTQELLLIKHVSFLLMQAPRVLAPILTRV
jgi:hypothetical protein